MLLNLVEGGVWSGSIALLSPSLGPFAKEFADLGVSVRIGDLSQVLKHVRDVRAAVCNTIMTAHNVLELDRVGIPSMWILHEWWPGQMLVDELSKRNDKNTSPEIVKKALEVCKRTVCVCNNQLKLYGPKHGQAVFVGVPDPAPLTVRGAGDDFEALALRKTVAWARRWDKDGSKSVRQYRTDRAEWNPYILGAERAFQALWDNGDLWIVEGIFDLIALEKVIPSCDAVCSTLRDVAQRNQMRSSGSTLKFAAMRLMRCFGPKRQIYCSRIVAYG